MPNKISAKDDKYESTLSEILNFDNNKLAKLALQFIKNNWNIETKNGNKISFKPIMPLPSPTQKESIDKARPKKIASFVSISFEWLKS